MVIKRNSLLLWLTAFYLDLGIIRGILQNISIIFGSGDEGWEILRPLFILLGCAVILIAGLCSLKLKTLDKRVIYIFCCWGLLFFYSYILNPSLDKILLRVMFSSIQVFIIILLFSQINDIERLENKFSYYILLTVMYSVLQFFCFMQKGGYSMDYSYNTMIPVLLSLCLGINHKKKIYLYLFIYFFLINVICGSRGSIICYCIAISLLMYLKNKEKVFIVLLPVVIVCLLSYRDIFSYLEVLFPGSRTIELFASGEAVGLSGRDEYYKYIISMFLKEPWKIHGIYSDRLFLADYFHRTLPTEIFGSYAHNFFLEVLFQFGIIGISILFFCFIIIIYSVFYVKKKKASLVMQDFFIISFAFCIGQLMFSSSYLTSDSFGVFAGTLLVIFSRKETGNDNNACCREQVVVCKVDVNIEGVAQKKV